jgi:hypothetical protein
MNVLGKYIRAIIVIVAGIGLITACSKEDQTPLRQPNLGQPGLSIVSGNLQVIRPGDTLPEPMVVEYRDDAGKAIIGTFIWFKVTSGPAAVLKPVVPEQAYDLKMQTDWQGRAIAQLRAYNLTAPATITVSAWAEDDPSLKVVFTQSLRNQ